MQGLLVSISVMMPSMKYRWFKVLWRFWPGLLCLVVTLLLLAWGLEPRPRSIASFPFDGSDCELDHIISPDGKYLATLATGMATGHGAYLSCFALHEISSQRELFCQHEYINEFRFDADGTLAYLVAKRHRGAGKKELLQLHRSRSDMQLGHMVWEHESIDPKVNYRAIDPLSQVAFIDCQLSPDTRTLLFATYERTSIRGEIINGLTGVGRTSFAIPVSSLRDCPLDEVRIIFTHDSKSIVVQTCEIKGAVKHFSWHWIDSQTGKELQRVLIPSELIIEKNLFATATTPVAKATNRQGENMLVSVNNREVQAIQLDEVKQPSSERGQDKIEPHVFAYTLLPEHNLIAYQWAHYRVINESRGEFLPNDYWSIRELNNGSLVQTSRINFIDRSVPEQKGEYCNLVTILPGPHLLFMHRFQKNTGVIQEWLNKARAWFGKEEQQFGLLHLINGTNGELVNSIHIPQEQTSAVLSPDGKSLMVFSGYDTRIELRTYDCPLHQPWLLIWSWALGIALAVTLLAEARRIFPWRKRLP